MDAKLNDLTEDQSEEIRQILLVVGEIDALNDDMRLLYVGKYFARIFYKSGIKTPPLFRGEQIIDFFDKIVREQQRRARKRERRNSSASTTSDTEYTWEEKLPKLAVKKVMD